MKEEKKKAEEEQKQAAREEAKRTRPRTRLNQEERRNQFNPFYDFWSEFDESDEIEEPRESREPRARAPRQPRARVPQSQAFEGIPRELIDNFFWISEFFNDNQFENFGGVFHENFNPGDFMNNFHANFRSSGGFEDLLEHIMRNQQPATNPASRDVVDKLPIIKVEEKHCKKIEGKEEVEPPSCPVCIEEIAIGKNAMFMPCGHTYHPECLKPWLKDHNTCPTCRMELPAEN